jgi:hypothetical protein
MCSRLARQIQNIAPAGVRHAYLGRLIERELNCYAATAQTRGLSKPTSSLGAIALYSPENMAGDSMQFTTPGPIAKPWIAGST